MKCHHNDVYTQKMEKLFPNADWKCFEHPDELMFHGMVDNIVVAFCFQKADCTTLQINTYVSDLISTYVENLEDDARFLLHNAVFFNMEEHVETLRKIFDYTRCSLKRRYIEQKREQIYGERHQEEIEQKN